MAELRAAGLSPEPTPWSAWGLRLPSEPAPNVQALEAFKSGRIEIQDEGSQIVSWLAGAAPGMTVVDYCAGGGGKTVALAQMMTDETTASASAPVARSSWSPVGADADDEDPAKPSVPGVPPLPAGGRLIACDVMQKRLDNIRPRLARAGVAADLRLIGQNGGGVEEFNGKADLVFVDAPCSGSGSWRRHPEDAWRLKPDEVERLHALQLRILAQAALLVKRGGRLVYVTCSLLTRENEAVADAFEASHSDFRAVAVADLLATPALTDAARARLAQAASGHRLRLSPASTHTDGFFAAVYERTA